jgi:hypothetical protein
MEAGEVRSMNVIPIELGRVRQAAEHYEGRQAEAVDYAAALAHNELQQRAALMGAMAGIEDVKLRDVRGLGAASRVITKPLPEILAQCLEHETAMAALIVCLRKCGGEEMSALRIALADALVADTVESITDVELGRA